MNENNPYSHAVDLLDAGIAELSAERDSCTNFERKAIIDNHVRNLTTTRNSYLAKKGAWATENSFGGATSTVGIGMVVATAVCGSLLR